MDALQFKNAPPLTHLSKRAIPRALHLALKCIFANYTAGIWLVGGTALAGFYAQHRRSDDLDLFTADRPALQSTLKRLRTLKNDKAVFFEESLTPDYYHTLVRYGDHEFTVDIVVDGNLHRVGNALRSREGILHADLTTLSAMKMAALISRASEKDLFDLNWILSHLDPKNLSQLVKAGATIDAGLTLETLLISLKGATLRQEACGFALSHSKLAEQKTYNLICKTCNKLIRELIILENQTPLSAAALALQKNSNDVAVKNQRRIKS